MHRDVLLDGVGSAVKFPRAVPAKIERRLAEGLRRNRPEIDAASTKHGLSLDDRDLLIELRALDCGALPAGPGTDHQKIVVERIFGHSVALNAKSASCTDNAMSLQYDDDNSMKAGVEPPLPFCRKRPTQISSSVDASRTAVPAWLFPGRKP